MARKQKDYATLQEYQRMSDTVDSLSAQKNADKPAAKTRQEKKAERKEAAARRKSEKQLKKKAKKLVIPKTAQETIPYVRVYPVSGIIETSPGVFSRGYLLQDINYTSAKDDEQTDMFLKFAEFLNTFDPSTRFQIMISQQNLNLSQFENETMMTMAGDGHDDLRIESNEEIRTKIREGRNNLIKNKYLFISRTEESYDAALTSFSRLDGEIARIYNKLTEMEHQNPLEQMRLAADNYNRYGHYMAALKNYHHVVYQMTHDYDSEMTRQFKADTWHNMGMAFLRLHNIKCAAECMKRAFELVKTQDFLAPYMYVLELLGDHEKILTLIRQEDIPTDISDAILNRYKEVEHLCEHSEENRKIQDGLTLGNGQTTAKYWDFVRDYLDRQKKNYDLT